MTKNLSMLFALSVGMVLTGCAGMDLRVDTLPTNSLYGSVPPRVITDKCRWYTKDDTPHPSTFTVLAQYVIQETPTVMLPLSAHDMICHAYEKAVKNGADAIIVDEMTTTNVAGGYARTSPVVKARAIRFNGDLPKGFNRD